MTCRPFAHVDDLYAALDGDHGDEARRDALGHLNTCASCRAVARARMLAKSTWDAAMAEAAERDLDAPWPRPRPAPRTLPAFGLGLAVAVLALALVLGRGFGGAKTDAYTARVGGTHGIGASARAVTPTLPPPASTPLRVPRLRVASACVGCAGNAAPLAPGARLEAEAAVTVPARQHLTLAFAVAGDLVDPEQGIDLTGPAALRTERDSIHVDRGEAVVRTGLPLAITLPHGTVDTTAASYRVVVDGRGRSEVTVLSGSVRVAIASGDPVSLAAGQSRVFMPPEAPTPRATEAPRVAVVTPTVVDVVDAARAARRSAFTQAEIDLAEGRTAAGIAGLEALVGGPDAALGMDAALILARTRSTAAERVAVWERLLASAPPTPIRERAEVQRVEALIDASRVDEARTALARLEAWPLPNGLRERVDRLRYATRKRR